MFCPTCQSDLHDRLLLDLNLEGYACERGHLFYSTRKEQQGGIPAANTVRPLPDGSDIQVLKFWLTDPRAREALPNQLALVCRRVVEIIENNHHVIKAETPFAFCPACGDSLSRFDSHDLYMQGLRCGNGHEFWERGGTINFIEHGARANLSAELDDEYLPALLEYWLGDSVWIQPYVHPQLRGVLKRFGG
jgi:hypothetical protein